MIIVLDTLEVSFDIRLSWSIKANARLLKLKARAGTIFVIARNLMMGTPKKDDKSAIQKKYRC